jgi:hypothetical protein
LTAEYIGLLKDMLDFDQLAYPSRAMGMQSDGVIASITRPGERHSFEFILGFEFPVWITLLITMLLIPLSFANIEKSFSGYFKNLWNYSYLILSEPIPKLPKTSMKRFILTFWLLACTVLLSGYSGVLRNLFMRPNLDDVIESWEDLYDRKDMKILSIEGSAVYNFVRMKEDRGEMARDFTSRLKKIKIVDLLDINIQRMIFEKL